MQSSSASGSDVVKDGLEGFLRVQFEGKLKRWARKWLKLDKDGNLDFYDSQTSVAKIERFSMNLKELDSICKTDDVSISLRKGAKEVLLQSQDVQETEQWLKAFQNSARRNPSDSKKDTPDVGSLPVSYPKNSDPDEGVDVLGEILGGNSEEEYDPAEDAIADMKDSEPLKVPSETSFPSTRATLSKEHIEQFKGSQRMNEDKLTNTGKARQDDAPRADVKKDSKGTPAQAEQRNGGSSSLGDRNNGAKGICGVGMVLEPADPGPDGFCEVRSIKEGGSVWCEGTIRNGDLVLRVDELDCRGVLREEIKKRVLGREGTVLLLEMFRKDYGSFKVELIRSSSTGLGKRENTAKESEVEPNKKPRAGGQEAQATKADGRIGREPAIKADSRIGREPAIKADGRIGREPAIKADSRIGREPAIKADGRIGREPTTKADGRIGREPTTKADSKIGKQDAGIQDGERNFIEHPKVPAAHTPVVFALFTSAIPNTPQHFPANKAIEDLASVGQPGRDQPMSFEANGNLPVQPGLVTPGIANANAGIQDTSARVEAAEEWQQADPAIPISIILRDAHAMDQLESFVMLPNTQKVLNFDEIDRLVRKIAEVSKVEKIDSTALREKYPETYKLVEGQMRSLLSDSKISSHQLISMLDQLSLIGWDGKKEPSSSLLPDIVKVLSKSVFAMKHTELARLFSSLSPFSCASSCLSSSAGWSLIKKVENSVKQMNNFEFLAVLDALAAIKVDMSSSLNERACDRLKRLLLDGRTEIGMDRMVRLLLLFGKARDCARNIEVIRLIASKIRVQALQVQDLLAVLLLLAERDITLSMAILHDFAAQLAKWGQELVPPAATQALWALCSLEWRDADSKVMDTLLLSATQTLHDPPPQSSGSAPVGEMELSSVNAARLLWVLCRLDMQDRAEKFVPALERRIMVDPGQLGGRDITDLAYAIEKLELKVSLSMQQEISRAAAKFVSSYSSGELAVTLSGLTFGGHALCEELVEAIPLSSRALGRNLSASTAISILQALSSGLESSGGEIGGEHRKSLATSILLDVARMLDRCDTQQVAKIVLVCSRLQLKVQQEVETSFARKFLQLLERYSTAIRGGSRAQQGGRPSSDFQQANFQREFQHLFLFARTSYSLGWDSPLHAQYLDMLREVTLFFARSSDPAVVLDMYVSLSSGEELESCLRARFPELLLEGEQEELPTAVTGDALGGQRGGLQMKNFLSSLLKLIMDLRDRMQAADLGRFYLLLLLSGDAKEEARSSTWVGIFSKLAGKLEEVPAKTCCMIICSLALLGVIPSVEALGQAVKRVVRGREELSIADRSCMLLALGMFNQTQLVPDFKELYDEMLDTLLDEQTSSESEKAKSKDSEDVDMFDVEDVKEKERRIRMRESLSNPYLHAQMAIMLLFSQVILCNNDNSMEDVWKKNGSETNSESREVALLTTMLMRLRQALLSDAGKVGEDAVEKKLGKSSLERFYMLTSLVGLISPQATATLGEREKETMETIRMAGKKCLMLLQDFTDGEEGSRCLKEISETAAEFGVELRVGRRDEGAGFLLPLSNEEKKVVLDVVRAEDELFSPEETSLRLNGRFELRRQILSLSGWSLLQVRLSSWKLVREVNVEKKKFLFRGDRLRNYISSEFEEECILRALPRLHHRVEVMRLLEALLCIHDGFVRMDAGTIALCLRKLGQQNPMDNSRRLQEIVFQSGLLAHCSSKLDEMDGSQQAQLFNDVVSIWIEVGRPRSRFPTSLMVTLMKLGEEAMKGDNLDLSMVANMCSGILEAKDELPKEVLSQTLLALVNRCKDEEFVRLLQVDVVVPVFACTCLMRSLSVGQHLVDMIAVEKLKEKIDGCGAELRTRHVQTIFWWMGCAGDRSVNFSYRLIKRLQQQVGEMSAQELKDVVCFHAQLQLFLSTEMGLQMMDRFKQLDVLEALPLNDCVFILSSFALSCVEDETFVLALLRRIDLLERSPAMSSSNEWNVEMEIRFLWCCVAMPCLCNTLFRPDRTDSSEQPLSSFSSLHTRCRFRILERWTKNQFSVQGTREEKRLSQLELSMLCQYHVAVRLLIAQGCSNAQLERLGLVRNQSVTLEKQRKTVSCKVYGEAADVFKDMGYEPCRDFESFCYDRDTMEGRGRSRERAAILGDKRISVGSLKYWKDTSKSDKTFLDVRDLVHAIVELFAETSDRHADRNGARLEASSSSPLLDFDHHIGLSPDPDWDEAFPSARDENSDEERKDEGGSSARKHVSRKKKASKLLWSVHYSKTKERWFYYNNDTKQRVRAWSKEDVWRSDGGDVGEGLRRGRRVAVAEGEGEAEEEGRG
ncbi:hypothetical protein GUITHDRAFT_138988 [Guillardia theta CCMP2712]|uniref:PH domain-containing protein n=4 Tax=Guillardia theta TaxID=55529 RepID=L1JBB9_GUITC|nr:hypothetical protein GUITHDRAFT_138988 [Guillardia theta CCMP2712]EKX45414.1 hypothetical protein GUITHDRAFT_138988 [Guillardia theta CCMP2712]|eukprot:XP_005832394.1 hypothetical protein GUITHDRAFT_138988 [Guillardia theta CCMP2712]